MEAHLAPAQIVQVNKVSSSCVICSGPHDTHYCMKNPEQAFVDYASSQTNKVGGKRFTLNHGPRNFNGAANTWKEKPNFNWAHTQTFTNPQGGLVSIHSYSYQIKLEKALLDFDSYQEKRSSHLKTQLRQQQNDMIGKINLLWKTVFEKLNDASPPENAGNSMAPKSIAAISHDEKEELRKKGIKSPSKLLSPICLLNKILKANVVQNARPSKEACQHVIRYHDINVAEFIYKKKPQLSSLVNYLCKDLSEVCSTKPPPVPKEPCAAKSAKETEMDKMLRSMEGLKLANNYIFVIILPQREQDGTMVDEDDTQDTTEDELQLNRMREWIKSYLDDVDVIDALSAFLLTCIALIEGLILKAGNNSFNIKRVRVGE
ncbi:hypothetical protein Tco_1477239 [Tanacetum coccineum]